MVLSAGAMGLATAVSRLLGFARDWLIAVFYGTSPTAQAFVVAFRVPNLFRDLVGEGASNAAFVPVFSRTRAREGEASWAALAQAVWARLLIGFIVLCVRGVLLAPWITRVGAPGFRADPVLFQQTTRLMRILFPFLGLIAASAFFMGVLNSIHHFTLPSLGPALLNVCMIAGIFAWKPDALGLAWGIIVGGFAQIAIQVPQLRRAGIRLKPAWRSHPGVNEIRRLLIPRALGTAVYQGDVLVDTIFASFRELVGSGGVASLYFANRFLQLPLGLFGVSMAQAALPTLSHHVAVNDMISVRATFLKALRSILLIAIPSAVGLLILGRPIIATLLERGAFLPEATAQTVSVLRFSALGLVSICAVKVLVNVLYAFHDTWTPVRSAAIALLINLVLDSILVFPLKLGGLALATAISSTWNCAQLYQAVRKRLGPMEDELKGWSGRVIGASVGMGFISWIIWTAGQAVLAPAHSWQAVLLLLAAISGGSASFVAFCLWLRVEEIRQLLTWIFRRR